MWINPLPFGIFIGAVSTIVVEVVALIIIALCRKGDK